MELTSRRSIVVFLSTPRKTTRKDVLSEHPAKPGDAERERSEEDHGRRREKERSRLLEIEHVFFQKGKSPLDCSDAIGDGVSRGADIVGTVVSVVVVGARVARPWHPETMEQRVHALECRFQGLCFCEEKKTHRPKKRNERERDGDERRYNKYKTHTFATTQNTLILSSSISVLLSHRYLKSLILVTYYIYQNPLIFLYLSFIKDHRNL